MNAVYGKLIDTFNWGEFDLNGPMLICLSNMGNQFALNTRLYHPNIMTTMITENVDVNIWKER